MSTTISPLASTMAPDILPGVSVISGYGYSTENSGTITISPLRKAIQTQSKQPKPLKAKVLRRLKGFVVSLGEEEYRVAFDEDGEYYLYDWPAADLKKRGITSLNQPFEMDEVSIDLQPYSGLVAYEFRPLAKASEGFLESLPIDDERKSKLELIKAKFSEAAKAPVAN